MCLKWFIVDSFDYDYPLLHFSLLYKNIRLIWHLESSKPPSLARSQLCDFQSICGNEVKKADDPKLAKSGHRCHRHRHCHADGHNHSFVHIRNQDQLDFYGIKKRNVERPLQWINDVIVSNHEKAYCDIFLFLSSLSFSSSYLFVPVWVRVCCCVGGGGAVGVRVCEFKPSCFFAPDPTHTHQPWASSPDWYTSSTLIESGRVEYRVGTTL